jgi:endonuclease/exonuclease/phosphatase family metal-dependent hydrolase
MRNREHRLHHELSPCLPRLARIRTRRQLDRDPLYRRLRPEIDRVVSGLEWRLEPVRAPHRRSYFRAVAWNIERGKRFTGICELLAADPVLREADLLLLTEVDIGMGRSGGRNVARELADRLGMAYLFANGYLLLSPGDKGERGNAWPAGLSLHGNALLSRWPIGRFEGVALPEWRDKFHAKEKRLGQKRAVVAEVLAPGGPVVVAVVHTDPFAPPKHRAAQVRHVLATVERFEPQRVLLGGDLNTNTWDLGGPVRLGMDLSHKWMRFGFEGSIEHYLTPGRHFERELFRALAEHGLTTDGVNDLEGTTYFDTTDSEMMKKYVPKPLLQYLKRRLKRWNGVVPLRIDWFAVRGLKPAPGHLAGVRGAATTVVRPTWLGQAVSDHDPIVTDLK